MQRMMQTSPKPYLHISVVGRQGELPAVDSISLAPGDTVIVGRAKERCHFAVPDRCLSPVHFRVSASASQHVVRDLSAEQGRHNACESTCFLSALRNQQCSSERCAVYHPSGETGLYLNNQRIQEAAVRDGDLLVAGSTCFRIEVKPEPIAVDVAPVHRGLLVAQRDRLIASIDHGRAFALLDAARGPGARSLLLQFEDLSYSLYDGRAGERLAEVAPYLVKLRPDSQLLRTWLSEHWGQAFGYVLETDVPFKALRRHLRKFLKVSDSRRRRMYFRFYDPRVLRTFLPTCAPPEIVELFGPITRIVLESHERATALAFSASRAGLTTQILPLDAATSAAE